MRPRLNLALLLQLEHALDLTDIRVNRKRLKGAQEGEVYMPAPPALKQSPASTIRRMSAFGSNGANGTKKGRFVESAQATALALSALTGLGASAAQVKERSTAAARPSPPLTALQLALRQVETALHVRHICIHSLSACTFPVLGYNLFKTLPICMYVTSSVGTTFI